ncbi:MAG: hypothetical protein ACP5O0_11720, partial [Acidimicrobiales bacterium]
MDLVKKFFGPDTGTLKRKNTRKAPPRVKEDLVEAPPELKEKSTKICFSAWTFSMSMECLCSLGSTGRFGSKVLFNWTTE